MGKGVLRLIIVVLIISVSAFGRTIYVNANGTGDYPTIQAAINDANDGDEIVLQPGTYTGSGNYNIDFLGKAITVRSTDPNDPDVVAGTVIDCENVTGRRGFYFHSGEGPDSVVAGLTVTRGRITGYPARGGGICCNGASPQILRLTISDCVARGNNSLGREEPGEDAFGGGICCYAGSNSVIKNCVVTDDNAIGGDASPWGPPGVEPRNGGAFGGGIYYSTDSNGTVEACVINNNSVQPGDAEGAPGIAYGGGLYAYGSSLAVANCIIAGNNNASPHYQGGGIVCESNPKIKNCTVTGNTAASLYGGIYCRFGAVITNSIIWNNSGTQVAGAVVSYCDVQGGYSGTGNINADPCFVSGPFGGHYLSEVAAGQDSNSPCVNAGSDTAANLGMDIVTTRTDEVPDAGIVDMGYHYNIINAPILSVSPSNLDFEGKLDRANPPSQTITITNTGSQPLNWTATVDANWLSIDVNSGTCPESYDANTVSVDVNIVGLAEGIYDANIVVSDPCAVGSPRTVAVQLRVIGPVIGLSDDGFYFEAEQGGANPASQVLGIQNIGGGILDWQATDPCDWLDVDPNSGSSVSEVDDVNIIVDILGLTEGIHICQLTVSSDNAENSPQTVSVVLNIFSHNKADLNKDSVVDSNDFAILASQWYQTPGTPSADIAPPGGDNFVDYDDLSIFCQNWLDGVPGPNLVAWWAFDEGSGSIAYDSAGNNDGTVYGAVWTIGQIGGALDFDGTNDYVEVPDDSSLRFSQNDSFSISLWCKPLNPNKSGDVISKMTASGQPGCFGYELIWSYPLSRFAFSASKFYYGSTDIRTDDNSAPAGDWYHVAAVYDNKDMKIYLNGTLQRSGTFTYDTGSTTPDKNLAIGVRSYDSAMTAYFDGLIDDVWVYNKALSEDEVEQLYLTGN